MDGGEDGDDDDGDSSGDDAEDENEEDKEEMEEHLAPAYSVVVVPTVELVSPPKGTKPVTPPLPLTIIPPELGLLFGFRLPYPSTRERFARCTASFAHLSPPHVPSPLLPSFGCPTQIQTLRIASTHALVDAVTTVLPSPPLPPSLYIPPPVDRKDDIPESERPPRKRSCLFSLGSKCEVGESSTARPTRGISQTVHYELQTHREHVYAYESQIQAHQTHLQLQGTLIQTQHQVHETRSQMQQTEMAELRETGRRRTVLALLESSRGELDNQDQMLEFQITRMLLEMPIVTSSDLCHFTLRGPNTPPNNTNPNNITPESVQAMIDQALQRNSTNGDGGHRNEGVVGLTWWIEKMESFFNISGCAIENQVKFATCTLLGAALTWWNGQIKENLRSRCMIRYFGKYSRKKMSDKYCSAGRNQRKLEIEFLVRNLKVKGE
ncbi:hypothetical protein Tco_0531599 [Tanacetum coccineum]